MGVVDYSPSQLSEISRLDAECVPVRPSPVSVSVNAALRLTTSRVHEQTTANSNFLQTAQWLLKPYIESYYRIVVKFDVRKGMDVHLKLPVTMHAGSVAPYH